MQFAGDIKVINSAALKVSKKLENAMGTEARDLAMPSREEGLWYVTSTGETII